MQINEKTRNSLLLVLRIGFFALLLGRSWQAFRFDLPLRAFFWNETLLSWLVPEWSLYVNDPLTEMTLEVLQFSLAGFWGVGALLVLGGFFETKKGTEKAFCRWLLGALCASIVLLSMLYFLDKGLQWAVLVEQSSQYGIGLCYFFAIRNAIRPSLMAFALMAVSFTFIGHGLYAMGVFYPQPGHYLDMTINLLGVTESLASILLKVMGAMDVIVAVVIWIPKFALLALRYILFWGAVTAMARVFGHLDWLPFGVFVQTWLHEVMIRIPHVALPLFIYLYLVRILRLSVSRLSNKGLFWSRNQLTPKSF